ncbi:MAG: cysteine ABC transporter permease, partial [Aristaeellaceae bacterium]
VKDTSLASNIMIAEMFRKAQEFAASSLKYLLIYSEVALIYLLFCTLLNGVQKLCEKRLRLGR